MLQQVQAETLGTRHPDTLASQHWQWSWWNLGKNGKKEEALRGVQEAPEARREVSQHSLCECLARLGRFDEALAGDSGSPDGRRGNVGSTTSLQGCVFNGAGRDEHCKPFGRCCQPSRKGRASTDAPDPKP